MCTTWVTSNISTDISTDHESVNRFFGFKTKLQQKTQISVSGTKLPLLVPYSLVYVPIEHPKLPKQPI